MTREGLFRKNSRDSGHYHSNWLSMMYPRLFLARNLLKDDGVIFVSIDDHEVHNLRLMMNEVFGEENFRNSIVIKRGAKSVQAQFDTWDKLGNGYETVLFYTKNNNYRFPKMKRLLEEAKEGRWNNHWRGTDRPTMRYELFGITPDSGQWRWSVKRSYKAIENYKRMLSELEKTDDGITENDIDKWYMKKIATDETDIDLLRKSKNGKPEHYIAPSDSTLLNDIWFDFSPHSSSILKKLFGKKIFDNPKPLALIQRILEFGKEDIILDFFSGSCTTAHAVLDLNKQDNSTRKFICVQLPEKCDEKSEAFKAGYKTIADIGKERIRRVIKKIKDSENGKLSFEKTKQDLGFKVFKLQSSNFKIWRGDNIKNGKQLEKHMQLHLDSVKKDATEENMLFELLLKSGRNLNSKIENTNDYYRINNGEIIIALSRIDEKMVDSILEDKPQVLITLDRLFKNNDQLKTNTLLQMKDAGIELKVV